MAQHKKPRTHPHRTTRGSGPNHTTPQEGAGGGGNTIIQREGIVFSGDKTKGNPNA